MPICSRPILPRPGEYMSDASTIIRSPSSTVEYFDSEEDSESQLGETSCASLEHVFFGTVGEKEKRLIAQLEQLDLDEAEEEKQFDLANSKRRIARRDSREFHRSNHLGKVLDPVESPQTTLQRDESMARANSPDGSEISFDPESPMPLCRAPPPGMLVPPSPPNRLHDTDGDILPSSRDRMSLSPIKPSEFVMADVSPFKVSQSIESPILRLRSNFSPVFDPMLNLKQPTACSTPAKAPLHASTMSSVTRLGTRCRTPGTLDKKAIKKQQAEYERARQVSGQLDLVASRLNPLPPKPVLSTSPCRALPALQDGAKQDDASASSSTPSKQTPTPGRRKSLRLIKMPKPIDLEHDAQVLHLAANTPLPQDSPTAQGSNAVGATPLKPAIVHHPVTNTPSGIPRPIVGGMESKIKPPTRSLLKKPSASLHDLVKSSARPNEAALPTRNFDFVQPLPAASTTTPRITTSLTSSKPRQPRDKSPKKGQDVFSFGGPVKPLIKGPIASSSTGPPVRPNMNSTPVRAKLKSFGSPMRSPAKVSSIFLFVSLSMPVPRPTFIDTATGQRSCNTPTIDGRSVDGHPWPISGGRS